jgi:hypothetical protein
LLQNTPFLKKISQMGENLPLKKITNDHPFKEDIAKSGYINKV